MRPNRPQLDIPMDQAPELEQVIKLEDEIEELSHRMVDLSADGILRLERVLQRVRIKRVVEKHLN